MIWPEALALCEGRVVHSCALWMDADLPLALPPVELLVIRRSENDIGVLPADELITAAGGVEAAGSEQDARTGSCFILPSAATKRLFAESVLQPIGAYRFVDLFEFSD